MEQHNATQTYAFPVVAGGRQRQARLVHLGGEQVRYLVGGGYGPYVLGASVLVPAGEPSLIHESGVIVSGGQYCLNQLTAPPGVLMENATW